ncbi:hypothetical protein AAA799E16_01608 [Marine Group I thaumarchaeote SCGC AAA799-E16]|uniref:Uncharacterized protein n=3 Tax=Marine Group I TaxID=905826 RepID=A0A081RMG7_9ARCH|nr:hypothetical protein AAA799N04_01157 [Marine Group I thaumarchaeote SCGC AAA799-N04]KER05708.1 hypothetical protein AAA799E16_01608 [Marine Group I thaumarchaeote SCGC AAA799-E16]KFM16659.1 hypothetical protein AAA799D11_00607 [Marine Group I thaumarchaeote SCGC AAA799-D11]
MKFERRDIILIVGLLLFMIGLIPFTSPAYAAIIVILMYFGIKFYVTKRRQLMERDVGEGICLECGAKIHEKKCPNCDNSLE